MIAAAAVAAAPVAVVAAAADSSVEPVPCRSAPDELDSDLVDDSRSDVGVEPLVLD